MQFKSVLNLLVAALVAAPSAAQHITKDTTDSKFVTITGNAIVDRNAWWTIYDANIIFPQALVISGGFYYFHDTARGSMPIRGMYTFSNSGIAFFKSVDASIAIHFLTNTFTNSGDFFFLGQNAPISLMLIPGVWTNTASGTFNLYFDTRPTNGAILGNAGNAFTNYGQICMRNYFMDSQLVKGNGCINIGENSVFKYQDATQVFPAQQILYLSTPTSGLWVGATRQFIAYSVAGFGGGNYIAHTKAIKSFSYNSGNGVLTVVTVSYTMKYTIGMGYDEDLFSIVPVISMGPGIGDSVLNSAITYYGDVPSLSLPAACKPCKDEPVFPPLPN